jgi:uncharacterized membrane protein
MEVPRKLQKDVGEKTLDAIAFAVESAETRTSAEIVVHLVHSLFLESPRRRALRAFRELGVDRTRERNGVLLFFVMKKRIFEIVADEGAHAKVGSAAWERIAREITEAIERNGFEEGACRGVALLGRELEKHFPRGAADVDELPDRPTQEPH